MIHAFALASLFTSESPLFQFMFSLLISRERRFIALLWYAMMMFSADRMGVEVEFNRTLHVGEVGTGLFD
jgi:hypothetical protein